MRDRTGRWPDARGGVRAYLDADVTVAPVVHTRLALGNLPAPRAWRASTERAMPMPMRPAQIAKRDISRLCKIPPIVIRARPAVLSTKYGK